MNDDTLLHRQVHPAWVKDNRATSQTFRPTPKDKDMLSVHDGDRIDAESAWLRYTRQGWLSYGVVAVKQGECTRHGLGVIPDPQPESPEHALIDCTALSRSRMRQVARRMTQMANERSWQFRPQDPP